MLVCFWSAPTTSSDGTSPHSERTIGVNGPLQKYLDDADVHEVMVVNGRDIWIEDSHGLRRVDHMSQEQVGHCLEWIARVSGRRLDLMSPVIDARLTDGSRACAVIPPVAVGGPAISVRKFGRRILPLAAFGDETATALVRDLVRSRVNVVVSGATSSGKTSLVTTVSQLFGPQERIVCVEDTAEIRFTHPHVVRLQTRPPNVEGRGEITLKDLVRASLRLRPDRLIVGEVRGSEVIDMLLALTSGHSGCWSTVHATSATDTVDRLVAMVLRDSPQWTRDHALSTVVQGVGAIIHVRRITPQRRHISRIVTIEDGRIVDQYRGSSRD